MRMLAHTWWLLALLISPGLVQADTSGWQEAVARLAHERTRAETCAKALKRYGDDAAKKQGALAYGEAKAEIDAVIAGLVVALAQDQKFARLPDLEARLKRGVKGCEAVTGRRRCVACGPGETGAITTMAARLSGGSRRPL